MKVLILPDSKWARGNMGGSNALLRSDDRMCCLGVYGAACGVPDSEMLHTAVPSEVNTEDLEGAVRERADKYKKDWSRLAPEALVNFVHEHVPDADTTENEAFEGLAATVNDSKKIDDQKRLFVLNRIFREAVGIGVRLRKDKDAPTYPVFLGGQLNKENR